MAEQNEKDQDTIHPAATVVVLRDAPRGLEVLLMQRASKLAFHGGAWVFPGGRVDAHEQVGRDDLEAARVAAVRESFEEARLVLSGEVLVPFAHWTTPQARTRRFATWFFAAVHEGNGEVSADGSEMLAHRWVRPDEALALRAAREIELPPPTFVTLSQLREFTRARDFLAHASEGEPFVFAPRPKVTPGGVISLYAGDVAYEDGEIERDGPCHRLYMFERRWSYERTP